jgi:hypothetical protein
MKYVPSEVVGRFLSFAAAAAIIVVLLGAGFPCRAQQVTATLSGTVRDTSGAVIPQAALTATNVATGVAAKTPSDSAGNYIFPLLVPGTYTLSAERSGFGTTVISGITLTVDQKATLDIVLSVGRVTQAVEVKGAAPLLSTTSASIGTVVGEQQIFDLPLNLRETGTLALLVPGTIDTSGRSLSSATGNGSGFNDNSYNAAGGRSSSNLILIDGMISIALNNGGFSLQPYPEMVQEFNIQNNVYDPAFGVASGSTMNLVTQSGTNSWHGSAFEYLRNQVLDSRNFFAVDQTNPYTGAEIPGTARPQYVRNQFGFAAGGPIRKGKTFVFGSYEGLRLIQGQSTTSQVPTSAEAAGNFNSFLTGQTANLCAASGAAAPANLNFDTGQLFYPASESLYTCLQNPATPTVAPPTVLVGTPISGNILTSLDSVAQKIMALFPAPNRPGVPNYVNQEPLRRPDNLFDVRVDETLSSKDQLFARFFLGNTNQLLPGSLPAFNSFQHFRGSNAVIGWTHTFGPDLVNDVRIGFQRDHLFLSCQGCPRAAGTLSGMGIENLSASVSQFEEYPYFTTNNFAAWGDNGYYPDILPDQIFKFEDTLTKIHGRHTMVAGADLNFWQTRGVTDAIALNGAISFNGQFSSLAGEIPSVSTISDLADLELGYPSQGFYTQNAFVNELEGGGWFSLFAQDTFRVSSRFSVEAGLRWEYRKQPYDEFNKIAAFYPISASFTPGDAFLVTALPDAANDALCSQAYFIDAVGKCVIMSSAMRRQVGLTGNKRREVSFGPGEGSFGPRLGLSWLPTNSSKLVLHAGAGIFNDLPITNVIGSFDNNNPVFTRTPVYNTAFGSPPPLTNGAPTTTETEFASAAAAPISSVNAQLMESPFWFTPTVYQWSFSTESQLTQNWGLDVAYIGNRGVHLDYTHHPGNQAVPGVGALQPRRPYPDFNVMKFTSFDGISRYNALTVKLTKRASKGLVMLTSYTYGKSLDENAGDSEEMSWSQNDNDPREDYGVTDNNVRQRLVISPVWQLPFGKGQAYLDRGGFVNRLAGGWEATGIVSFQSGYPFTVLSNEDFSNTNSPSPRPDRICNGAGPRTVAEWFDGSCFTIDALSQALANGTPRFGTSGRNILSGPPLDEWDVSLIKRNRITERVGLEFRAEFFNLFNHPNFAPPGGVIGTSSAVTLTSAAAPRDIQFGLKMTF